MAAAASIRPISTMGLRREVKATGLGFEFEAKEEENAHEV